MYVTLDNALHIIEEVILNGLYIMSTRYKITVSEVIISTLFRHFDQHISGKASIRAV